MKTLVPTETVEKRIFLIRGFRVMLDTHLAEMYGIKAFRLREQVKRNQDRFPGDFMFQLNNQEVEILMSQNAIPSARHLGGYLPHVFTQEGVAMLSSVLRSKQAIQINIAIMRAFVKLRETLSLHRELAARLQDVERKIVDHDANIQSIFDAIRRLMNPPAQPSKRIGFKPEGG